MSPITEALLIGSYAALLRGCLPDWRDGHVGDIDFICTRPAAELLLGRLGGEIIEHSPDRCYHFDRQGLNIDIDLRGHLLPTIVHHADIMDVPINGATIRCLVARPHLVAALRAVSWSLVPTAIDKAKRDVRGYAELGIEIDAPLRKAAMAFRKPV
jgi:hypothetical protein